MSITHEMVREAVRQERKAASNLPFCKKLYFDRLYTIEGFSTLNLSVDPLEKMLSELKDCRGVIERLHSSTVEQQSVDGFMGFELLNPSAQQWAFVSPEPGKEGMARATYFDEWGFTNHYCDRDSELLLWSLLVTGYVQPDPGALDRVAGGEPWARGLRFSENLLASSQGQITLEELYQPV